MTLPTSGLSGRDRELIEADAALAASAAGTPHALLVGGDAGIGKTTLMSEIVARARDAGFTVLIGHCLDVDIGMPLAPVLEALRAHVDGRLADTLPPVTRRLTPFLLAKSGDDLPVDLMSDLQASIVELTHEAPVLLLLEDMHWSDLSTQSVATSLARTMQGRFLLALTFRTDDLTRRHPFRRAAVEIGRGVGSHRLDLDPLDRDGIAGIVLAATGSADPAVVGSLLARSEGNPLYAEELLGAEPDVVPGALGDLLLARVDALADATVDLLRLASVNGARIDSDLLVQVSDRNEHDVDAALREALDANVLVLRGREIDFRHGLLQEAVYDDLLPGERTRAHARFATALEERRDSSRAAESGHVLARLAFHWDAAKDQPRSFVAAVDAGVALRRVGQNEAMVLLERAVDLWDRVPDPADLCGHPKADLLRHLAVGAKAADGDEVRALRFMREALVLVEDGADPLLASRVYATYGEQCHELDDAIGQLEAVTKALAYAEGPASPELAGALAAMAQCHWRRQRPGDALAYFERAIAVAQQAGAVDQLADALCTSGFVMFELGRCADGSHRLRDGARAADSAGLQTTALYAESDLAYLHLAMGEYAEAETLAADGRARARALGLQDPAVLHGEQLVQLWNYAGRLDDSDLLLEDMRDRMRIHRWRIARADNLLARGDLDAAMTLERETMALIAESSGIGDADHVLREVRLLCALDGVDEALGLISGYLEEIADTDSNLAMASAAAAVWTALTATKGRGLEAPDDLVRQGRELLVRALAGTSDELSASYFRAEALLASALAATWADDDAIDEWRAAEAAAARFGAYFVLESRIGLAAALLTSGGRDEGRALLVQAWDSARTMGARGHADAAAAAARRHRVQLDDRGATPSQLASLTPREREVLDVLATGASNRTISEALFISEKTVSVHVSNLLAKLGVSNRGEAAALAREIVSAGS